MKKSSHAVDGIMLVVLLCIFGWTARCMHLIFQRLDAKRAPQAINHSVAAPLAILAAPPKMVAIQVVATGYCQCQLCCPGGTGVTSRGVVCSTHPYGVAVAPKMIPYGTKLVVPGYHGDEVVVADDTGGAMRQDAAKGVYHVDLRFPSHQEALNWGRKKLTIYMVE